MIFFVKERRIVTVAIVAVKHENHEIFFTINDFQNVVHYFADKNITYFQIGFGKHQLKFLSMLWVFSLSILFHVRAMIYAQATSNVGLIIAYKIKNYQN